MINQLLPLQQLAQNNKLPPAFIISSQSSKLSTHALQFINWLFCLAPNNNLACGSCRICELFIAETLPEFMHVEPLISGNSKATKIEQIRDLIQFLQTKPQFTSKKIVLLSAAESINLQAANALLKILEEPPVNTHIVLSTSNP